jgi:putative ABC transport system substrate-binding protein
MRRREFIALLGGAVAIWPLCARAQQAGKIYRIGILEALPAERNAANLDGLRKGLRDLGYAEGRNLVIEYRSADGRAEWFPDLASELVRLKVDLIVTRGPLPPRRPKPRLVQFRWLWRRWAGQVPSWRALRGQRATSRE